MPREGTADFEITMENIRYSAPQRYYGTRILLVIKGTATVAVSGKNYILEESDILFVNRNDNYTVTGNESNIVICLSISSHFFVTHYAKYFHYYFECYTKELDPGRESVVAQLRRLLSEFVIANSRGEEGSFLEVQSALYQVMLLMTRFFKKTVPNFKGGETSDERIARIIQLIELRYAEPLTLAEMAESEYLSTSYLSRYFKQSTGMGFLEYLKMVRLKHSVEDLLYTSDNLFQIAVKNGFSTAKNFSLAFKSEYEQTPAQYRKEHQNEGVEKQEARTGKIETKQVLDSPEALIRLAQYLEESANQGLLPDEVPIEEREIIVGKCEVAESLEREKHILFIGELKELLKENVKEQVLLSKQKLRVDFVGVRHLIGGSTLLPEVDTDELVPTSPKYANSDLALQFLKNQGISLFFRIEYKEVIRNEEHFFIELDRFLVHALQIFGRAFVDQWQILYYASKETTVLSTELERIYLRIHEVIRKRSVQLRMGTFFPFREDRENLSIHHQWQFKQADKIDFIAYDADQNEIVDFSNISDEDFLNSRDYILNKTQKLKHFLKKHQLNKPLYLDSWNTLTGNTRYTNGTFFRGALILKTILDLSTEVEGLGFWVNNEIHEQISGSRDILVDGLELFHFFNGKRPAFFTLMFKERMKGKVIAQGVDYVMTGNEDGYQLLLFNEKHFNPRYSVDELFMRNRSKELHVRLLGVAPGEYQVRKYQFDKDNGGLYSKWGQLNSKYGVDVEVMDYIVQSSSPTLEIKDEQIGEDWTFYVSLASNAIQLIEYRRAIV